MNGLPPLAVLGCSQLLVFGFDGVEEDFLSGVVCRSDLFSALKHHMLKVMRYARVGGIFRSSHHDNSTKDLRLAVVFVEPYRQAIVQNVFVDLRRYERRRSLLHD